jgi:SAM-dependent methyltransferase
MTELRLFTIQAMEKYRELLKPDNRGWKVMEVGIAGDEKPGGNYKLFGLGNDYKTLDCVAKYEPDIIADICHTDLPDSEWDIILLSNTLEHIYDYRAAFKECFRLLKSGGYLIADIPFMYPYHPDKEFGDFWRLSPAAMNNLLDDAGFEVMNCELLGGCFTTALAKRASYV